MVKVENHPFANRQGYIFEHRLVWEKYNNAILLPWGEVHHINSITNDNRIENLEAMTHGMHSSLTHTKDMSNRQCLVCKSTKTFVDRNNYAIWHKHPITKEEWVCHNCDRRIKYSLKVGRY